VPWKGMKVNMERKKGIPLVAIVIFISQNNMKHHQKTNKTKEKKLLMKIF